MRSHQSGRVPSPSHVARRTLRRLVLVGAAIAVGAGSAAAYTFTHEASETKSPSQSSPCSAGAITGEARAWTSAPADPWTSWGSGAPATLVENLGTYGARWAWVQPLSQYALAPITQVNGVSDEVINAFKVRSQGAADNDDLSVDWFATGSSAGVAHIYQSTDPQWWWKPTVNITDDRPVVEVKVGSGNWTDSGVDADPDPDPATPGNQNDTRTAWLTTWTNPTPTTAAPLDSPGNSSGRFRGSKHISDHQVGTMVRVKVVLHISVSGDVDNATVEAWKVKVAARLVTQMH